MSRTEKEERDKHHYIYEKSQHYRVVRRSSFSHRISQVAVKIARCLHTKRGMSGNEQHTSLGTSLLYANQNMNGPPPDIFGAKIIVVQRVTEVDALVRPGRGRMGVTVPLFKRDWQDRRLYFLSLDLRVSLVRLSALFGSNLVRRNSPNGHDCFT